MTTVTNVSDSKLDRRNNTINSKLERRNSTSTTTTLDKKHHWARIKPALYATPKSTPLPDSPSSFPPSPYIVDHKWRGPRLLKSYSQDDVAALKRAPEEAKVGDNTMVARKETTCSVTCPVEQKHVNGISFGEPGISELSSSLVAQNAGKEIMDLAEDVACSVTCPVEQEHKNGISSGEPGISELSSSLAAQNGSAVQNGSAKSVEEELSSDNRRQPPPLDIECELHEIRLSLLMETENRKQVEEALDNMRSQWLRIRQQLSFVGLTLPAEPISLAEDERLGVDPVEELCRQVYLARFVSHSIGRGTAKAEVEMEMETHIESKNFEIARLWDKLHYYEAVNREMSQRNQEAVAQCNAQNEEQKQLNDVDYIGNVKTRLCQEVRKPRCREKKEMTEIFLLKLMKVKPVAMLEALAWTYLSTGGQSSSTSKSVAPQQDFAAD
ncbi:hypothetical protein RHSIM_Rhsim08G0119500 [Rhododendron simsii]|uniref:Uncharacterized protein n=1 Tax=Rhododendron simsii TaxID=118357 RepID=A0A834GN94_RHOSS|nr:hypothetical protein RHSIM_Rhsim08G0119500 [Rhododendron simsii]